MEFMTIGQVSREFAISTRALRYYETMGLLHAQKREGYAYRLYNEESIRRLRQILLLRKLRIPLQKIGEILIRADLAYAIEVFEENLGELEGEINALSAVKNLMALLVEKLRQEAQVRVNGELITDEFLLALADSLPQPKKLKEEMAMAELDKAQETLNKLTDRDVRILYLPPMTMASIHVRKGLGVSEDECNQILDDFVRKHELTRIKPDIRHLGFNHPDGTPVNGPDHGYEMWVSIPDAMEVEPPLTKVQFPGGLYAAHMIPMGAFEEWGWLFDWVGRSELYEYDHSRSDPERQHGMLEEALNYAGRLDAGLGEEGLQLDLLLPVRLKEKKQ